VKLIFFPFPPLYATQSERGEDGRSLVGVSRRRHAINAIPDHIFLKTNDILTKKQCPATAFRYRRALPF
jgi:hypothetical protein